MVDSRLLLLVSLAAACGREEATPPPLEPVTLERLVEQAWDVDLKVSAGKPRGPGLDGLSPGDRVLVSYSRSHCYGGERVHLVFAGEEPTSPWVRGTETDPWEEVEQYVDPILSVPWRRADLSDGGLTRLQSTLAFCRQPPDGAWEVPWIGGASLRVYWRKRGERAWVEEFAVPYLLPDEARFLSFLAVAEAAGAMRHLGS